MKIYHHEYRLNFYRAFVDSVVVLGSWCIAYLLRFQFDIVSLTKGFDTFENYLRPAPLLFAVYMLVFFASHVYDRAIKRKSIWLENAHLAKAHVASFFVFVSGAYFLFEHRYSRIHLLFFFFLVLIGLPLGRSFIRKWNRFHFRDSLAKTEAVALASPQKESWIKDLIATHPDWHVELTTCLDPSSTSQLKEKLEGLAPEIIFVYVDAAQAGILHSLYESFSNSLADVVVFLDAGVEQYLSPAVATIGNKPALLLNSSGLDAVGRFWKRTFDIVFAASFLLVFSPLYALIALAIKMTSPGPILYKQIRMGLDGRQFHCLKFRGMRVDAETTTGPVWAAADDPRVTPLGRWLRKLSLDEIPQFWNVLVGDMSVVGPRPERPVFVEKFRETIPGYMLRHKSKAGITGWAQLHGLRGNTSLEKRIQYDLWYIQNWSLWLDIKICLLTPLRAFGHTHAY